MHGWMLYLKHVDLFFLLSLFGVVFISVGVWFGVFVLLSVALATGHYGIDQTDPMLHRWLLLCRSRAERYLDPTYLDLTSKNIFFYINYLLGILYMLVVIERQWHAWYDRYNSIRHVTICYSLGQRVLNVTSIFIYIPFIFSSTPIGRLKHFSVLINPFNTNLVQFKLKYKNIIFTISFENTQKSIK